MLGRSLCLTELVSDEWYALSFIQEIRFASVVMPVIVSGSLVAFASASDGWYVLPFTQEIRFASVVMPVIVSSSLVALASVSYRWYALSFIQESRFASVGGHACHCVRFTRRLASVSDGWYVCHLFKEVDLPLWSCLFDTKSYESTIRAYSPGSTPGVRLLFLSYPLYVYVIMSMLLHLSHGACA